MAEEKRQSYWEKRKAQLDKALQESEDKTKKRLSKFYQTEYEKFDKEIAAYYTQYGTANVIAYRDMLQTLNASEIRLLMEKMDDFAELYPQYTHLMPVRASIYKLNRLEGLQTSVRLQQMKIAAVTEREVEEHLSKLAAKNANASMDLMGFGKNFYSIDSDIVKAVVFTKWSNGKNFSDRIWDNSNKLAEYLSTDIAQGFARGDNYNKLKDLLKSRFIGISNKDAFRLIFTEGTFVKNEASIKPFEEDFEQYRIVTRQNSQVCSLCKELEQKKTVFDIKDRKPGVNFPPFHPWCGCSYEIYVDDRDKWLDDYVKKHSGELDKSKNIQEKFFNVSETSSYVRVGSNEVNLSYINSEEYRKKFSRITGSSSVNALIRSYAQAMLTHRTGTDGEDLYIISAKTGELLFRNVKSTNILEVHVTKEEIKKIKELHEPFIGIHNHPTNILPTGSDFVAAGYRGYEFGIVVTHDGRIYKYGVGSKVFLPELMDSRVDKYMKSPYNLDIEKAQVKVLNEFREEYDITWEEIKIKS